MNYTVAFLNLTIQNATISKITLVLCFCYRICSINQLINH